METPGQTRYDLRNRELTYSLMPEPFQKKNIN